MKKFFIALFVLCLSLFPLAACAGGEEDVEAGGSSNENSTEQGGMSESDGEDTPQTGLGDVLVVYFSATNNTEKIAGYLAELTGGERFELLPQTPYTSRDLGYNNSDSRVSKEHADESLRNVPLEKTTVENWEKYNTVFLGYPIWWGIAAWPVNGFVTANDFTGKTVIPFCTSGSSGIGNSGTLLAQMAGTGEWKAGKRFSASASKGDVESWLDSLEL